ncbi:S46 family peptidase, partial [Salmonella enterica subsp. enterica serovar 1,4,[5],12:i:-]
RRYVPAMDRQLQQYWLQQYVALPADQRIAALDTWLGGNDQAAVDAALKRLDGTTLGSTEERLKWFKADKAAFEASKDPAIQYAVAVMPTLLQMEEQS